MVTPAKNLDDVTPQWTWHIENEKGEFVSLKDSGDVSLANVDVEELPYADVTNTEVAMDTQKNPNPYFVTKPISTNVLNRKIVNFKFSGTLEPGQRIVVELMVPLDISNSNIVSAELMQAKAYGFKNGSFRPYIPDKQGKVKIVAYEVDSHDVNDNKSSGDMTLTITSQAITLLSIDNVTQMKTATSDLDSVKAAIPVRVQEGGNYSYSISMQNSSDSDTEYKTLLFYDVLPYVDDTKATDSEAKRNSKWNGYLIPDSVQLKQVSSSGTVNLDPSMYTVWVGPIIKKNGSYVLQDVSILPKPADDLMDTEKNNFYRSLYQDVNGKNSYFVKLSELIGDHEAGRISDAEYDRLVRGIRAIWAQMNNADTRLNKKNRMELYYEMHAPLNLPKYVGTPTTEDENESAASAESIRKQVEGVTQWNTFASGYDSASAIGKNYQLFENTQAGAYISAPSGKGYIGSYVWSDLNYDAQCNEAEYEMSANGRLLPTGKWTTDIDFDGKPDDPGINGVKVELLTKKGYSVNVNGEAVIADPDPDSNPNPEKTRYVVIDEETGQPKTIVENNINSYQYTFDGPVTYTTESDYYGNQGYFMLSNLTPGDYRLRYTLPQGYDQYSVTTRELGQTGTALKVYRDGNVVYTGIRTEDDHTAVANEIANKKASSGQLIVQTAPIHVDAVEEDLTKHQAYDTAMTSYMLGVSRGYTYGGWAWVDETDNNGTIEATASCRKPNRS